MDLMAEKREKREFKSNKGRERQIDIMAVAYFLAN
jgi:hypothetical protein